MVPEDRKKRRMICMQRLRTELALGLILALLKSGGSSLQCMITKGFSIFKQLETQVG